MKYYVDDRQSVFPLLMIGGATGYASYLMFNNKKRETPKEEIKEVDFELQVFGRDIWPTLDENVKEKIRKAHKVTRNGENYVFFDFEDEEAEIGYEYNPRSGELKRVRLRGEFKYRGFEPSDKNVRFSKGGKVSFGSKGEQNSEDKKEEGEEDDDDDDEVEFEPPEKKDFRSSSTEDTPLVKFYLDRFEETNEAISAFHSESDKNSIVDTIHAIDIELKLIKEKAEQLIKEAEKNPKKGRKIAITLKGLEERVNFLLEIKAQMSKKLEEVEQDHDRGLTRKNQFKQNDMKPTIRERQESFDPFQFNPVRIYDENWRITCPRYRRGVYYWPVGARDGNLWGSWTADKRGMIPVEKYAEWCTIRDRPKALAPSTVLFDDFDINILIWEDIPIIADAQYGNYSYCYKTCYMYSEGLHVPKIKYFQGGVASGNRLKMENADKTKIARWLGLGRISNYNIYSMRIGYRPSGLIDNRRPLMDHFFEVKNTYDEFSYSSNPKIIGSDGSFNAVLRPQCLFFINNAVDTLQDKYFALTGYAKYLLVGIDIANIKNVLEIQSYMATPTAIFDVYQGDDGVVIDYYDSFAFDSPFMLYPTLFILMHTEMTVNVKVLYEDKHMTSLERCLSQQKRELPSGMYVTDAEIP